MQEIENNNVNNNIDNNSTENKTENKVESKTQDKNKNKKMMLLILILSLVVLIVIASFAYARYLTTKEASATAKIAEMICEIEVQESQADKTIINPYCTVIVKNYNSENKVTETDVKYKIEVTPKGDFTLPEYYWKDSAGTILAQSTAVTGTFEHGAKDEEEYKIVFLNSGEEDIVRYIDFNLVAIQMGNEDDGSNN